MALKKTPPPLETDALPLPPVSGLSSWYRDDDKAVGLQQLLTNPLLQEALAILLERSRMTQNVTATDPATHSAKLGWLTGYQEAIQDLRTVLTDPNAPQRYKQLAQRRALASGDELAEEEAWSYINQGTGIFANMPDSPD